MYLKRISLENVGPIAGVDLALPFDGERPLPLVLVGANGSGKTTLLSFIVNAIVAFKQQVFEDAEVDQGKVFRTRSAVFMRGGTNYYRAKLQFEEGLLLEEWVLDRNRADFEKQVSPLPKDDGWNQVPETQSHFFDVTPKAITRQFGGQPDPKMVRLWNENVALYFPSDRFEPPDWLNLQNLIADLKFAEPVLVLGRTARRVVARSLLKPTLDWLQELLLDRFIAEAQEVEVKTPDQKNARALLLKEGRTSALYDASRMVLAKILGFDEKEFAIGIEGRASRRFVGVHFRDGNVISRIPNLLGLSAGQSALFCLFCTILRDFDLAGSQFSRAEEVRGIVVIDEADLHLHLDLQYRVLPELIRTFPKVQFVITAHSPLMVMGMREALTEDGFWLVDMPSGERISTEAYSEFVEAFEAFGKTKTFQADVIAQARSATKPLLLVEGIYDKSHLEIAWGKLYPSDPAPFEIIACSDAPSNRGGGGARRLNAMLETLGRFERQTAIGLFDNDSEGAGQFGGLGAKLGFESVTAELYRRHRKGTVHAILLPAPPGRESFVPADVQNRVLELEHYYDDIFLQKHGAAEDPMYGSAVFRIRDSKKQALIDAARVADPSAFNCFKALFDDLKRLVPAPPVAPATS